jgi:hypothetical protein
MHEDGLLYCPTCARSCVVETPQCTDGHGAQCPERLCVVCGTALFIDPLLGARDPRVSRRRSVNRPHAA